jgi:hypothetical protein
LPEQLWQPFSGKMQVFAGLLRGSKQSYKALTVRLLHPYCIGLLLRLQGLLLTPAGSSRKVLCGAIDMNFPHPDAIWLIPPILAVSFLLWVLFNFWKEGRKLRHSASAVQPYLRVSTADCGRRQSRAESRGPSVIGQAMNPAMSSTVKRAASGHLLTR